MHKTLEGIHTGANGAVEPDAQAGGSTDGLDAERAKWQAYYEALPLEEEVDALKGFNRIHAILGASNDCIATNPSDMNVALAALNATIHVQGPKGKRTIAIADFHRLPGTAPQLDTTLQPDELITAVELPAPKFAKHSYYLKVRDRQRYAFALVSVAAGLEISSNTIQSAGLALGGVAHKPLIRRRHVQ